MERYRPIKQIGKGSFGNALLVQPISQSSKYLVMKIIDISKLDRKQKEEAVNEVHVLKALRHPFVVAYRESFVEKQCLCIVMDYADGGDLQSMINKQKQKRELFTEDQILHWFIQICLALKHIHDRQILHRDIKAQNIFLTSKNGVKLGDFGIARILRNEEDYARTAIGTPYYLSPEICDGRPYNQKSDIWSLGCILYQMIMLRHAFDATTIKDLMKKIMHDNFTPIPTTYSKELTQLVSEMLTKDPNQRPSINEILQKKFLNVTHPIKRLSFFVKEAFTPKSSTLASEKQKLLNNKKTLFKNQSEKDLVSRENHPKRAESYSLYKASFQNPQRDDTYLSPRLPIKSQPSQSQEGFEILTQSQIDHSDYFPDLGSASNVKNPGVLKQQFSLQLNSPKVHGYSVITPRLVTEGAHEERAKGHLKDRPKSHEKYFFRTPGMARQTVDTTYYSSVTEINNIITENLSLINNIKSVPPANNSVLSQGNKESPSCKYLVSDLLTPREDNRTPEGNLIDLMQIMSDGSSIKKEMGKVDVESRLKKIVSNPRPISHKLRERPPMQLIRVGDENTMEFEERWTLLEEKLGTYQLEKAYGFMQSNRGEMRDVQPLLNIIGDKNHKYVKDLEKLIQMKLK